MGNRLRLFTEPTNDATVFQVRWMTGTDKKGIVRVSVPDASDDGHLVAELGAARYLLEAQHVCGHDKTGAGLELVFSAGAIKKLARRSSARTGLVRYAHFLQTRFIGASILVENRAPDWIDFDDAAPQAIVARPDIERLTLHGFGAIEMTAHALEKYIERFNKKIPRAWRDLRKLMQDPKMIEVVLHKKRNALQALSCTRYFYLQNHDLLFVVTHLKGADPRLVTVYVPDEIKKQSIRAADRRNGRV